MKRKLAVVLFFLLLWFMPVQAFAQEDSGEPQLIVSLERAEPGETVTLTVTMLNNPGIMAINPKLAFDRTRLELLGVEDGVFKNWSATDKAAIWFADGNLYDNGVILKLNFKVLDDAPRGLAEVRLICGDGDAYNYEEQLILFRLVSGGVQIGEPDHEHVPAPAVLENETDPSCTGNGSCDEVIYCEECGAEISRITKVSPPTGHHYQAPTFVWNPDGSGASAVFTCQEKDDVLTLEAVLTSEMFSEEADGGVTERITATVELDGAVFLDSIERKLPSEEAPVQEAERPSVPGEGTPEQPAGEQSTEKSPEEKPAISEPSPSPDPAAAEEKDSSALSLLILFLVGLLIGLGLVFFKKRRKPRSL